MAGTSSSTKRAGSDQVELELAHPLRADHARALGMDTNDDLDHGAKIKLSRASALRLITAGYAANVDPQQADQVAAALGADPGKVAAAATGTPTQTTG